MMNKLIATLLNVKNDIEYNKHVKVTMKELSRLSTHELNDIGIARGDIYYIAHSSYKKAARVSAADVAAEVALVPNTNLKGFV